MKAIYIYITFLVFLICSCNNTSDKPKEDPNIKKTYREDGSLLSSYTMKNGKYDGIAYNYYKNGNVLYEFHYVNGLKEGIVKRYYEDGKLYSETPYFHDTIDGIRKIYYKNSIVSSEIPYKKGNLEPGLKEYYDNGKLKTQDISIIASSGDNTGNRIVLKVTKKYANVKFFSLKGKYPSYEKIEIPTKQGVGTITISRNQKDSMLIEAQVTTDFGSLQIIRTKVAAAPPTK
jgi:hypothetical protein